MSIVKAPRGVFKCLVPLDHELRRPVAKLSGTNIITDCREILEDFGKELGVIFNCSGHIELYDDKSVQYYSGFDLENILHKYEHDAYISDLWEKYISPQIVFNTSYNSVNHYGAKRTEINTYGYRSALTEEMTVIALINIFFTDLKKEITNKKLVCRKAVELRYDSSSQGTIWTIDCRLGLLPEVEM